MKRKLLFAAMLIAGALGTLRAQTDVTSTYITDADFTSTTNWTQSHSSEFWSLGNGLIGTYAVANSKTSTTDANHLATEYCFGIQCRWSTNYAAFTQTKSSATLPAGVYTISYDVQNTNTSTTSATYENKFFAKVGESTYSDTKTEWMSGNSAWTTHTISFSIDTETTEDFTLSLGYGTGSNNFGSGNTPHLYVSHLSMTLEPFIRPTAITLNESSLSLTTGEKSTLSVAYTPDNSNNDTEITWTTTDGAVATVVNGVVTAVGAGTATITATTANSKSAACSVTVADAAAPSFYSAIAEGDFYIVNAATGKFFGMIKNGWGTQAGLAKHGIPFTVAISDGKYTLDSHTYNNATDHFFNGTYVDGTSTPLTIVDLGSGKYSISTADGSNFVTASASDGVIANTAGNASNTLAQWYFVSKANLVSAFADATDASPVDATFYIGDPDFTRNHIISLLQNGQSTQNPGGETYPWKYTVSNYHFKGGANGNMCAETYRNNGGTITQTLAVENGKYVVKCQGFRRVDSGSDESYLTANDEKVALKAFNGNGEGTVASMDGASASFSNGLYNNEVTVYVTNGSLTIGVQNAGGNWCCFDNFELYYYGPIIGGEATEIAMDTETPMTAGKWYYIDIPVDGMYNLTTTTLSDIVYTTDGTILIEDEGDVTDKFSKAVNEELTAGRYYVMSSSAQNLEVTVGAYAYEVGAPTLSVADGAYTQSSTFTVTFPDAATNDPSGETALVASSKATVNGNEVDLSAVTNGFSLDLGSLTENTDYVIAIPANVYGYAGESMNSAINITLHTPVVFDGEYCLYDADAELFLARGSEYGTEASADKYGVPFNLVTNAAGVSSIEFVDWTGVYLFITGTSIYTDNASTGWKLVPTTGGYYLRNADLTVYATHSSGSYGEYVRTTATEGEATVWTLKTKAERDAIVAAYPTENIENVITASGISTTAGAFETYLSTNYNEVDCTSAIGTATFAGSAGDWTWNATARTQGGQPAYGTNFVEAWNATGSWTQTIDKANLPAGIYKITVQGYERRKDNDAATALYAAGYNLVSTFLSANGEQVRFTDWNEVDGKPTNTGGAVTAFGAGEAVNTVYVYLDGDTDLNLMVRKPNYIWDCWVIMNNFTLTRYEQAEATMVITDAKYATFVAPFDVEIPAEVEAYTVETATGATLNLTPVATTIPANTPVVLYKETALAATTFYGKPVAGTPVAGLLTGVYSDTPAPNGSYVLQNNDDKVGFYVVNTAVATPTVGANRAYLTDGGGSEVKAFFFDEGLVDAIRTIDNGKLTMDNAEIFNLAGQRMNKVQKGVNIVNGKKIMVK